MHASQSVKEIDRTLYVGIYLLWARHPFASSFCKIKDKQIMHASKGVKPFNMKEIINHISLSHELKTTTQIRDKYFESFKGRTQAIYF